MSSFEIPVLNAQRRYNPIGSRVEPPTKAAQDVGKLLTRRGPVRTVASYSDPSQDTALHD